MLLKAQHLMVLLNRLGDHVTVYAPMLDCRLFTLDLSQRMAQIRDIIRAREYDDVRNAVRDHIASADDLARAISSEIPDYGRLRDGFRQAGVIAPENLGEIRALLSQAQKSNPAHGGDIYYFAFDNNALRNRLYSQFLRQQSPRDPRYNFVLAKQVRNEINCREGKILGGFLNALKIVLPNLNAVAVFQNQNRLTDRLRLLALSEWNQLLTSKNCEVIETGSEKPNAPPDSDLIIIATYEWFAAKPGRKVVLFSSDNEFVVQSSGRTNLMGQRVCYPVELLDSYHSRWEDVSRLLYQLAVLYGRLDLQLSATDVIRLYGVWQDKGAEDWEYEHVRVTMDTGSSPTLKFKHEMIACDIDILNEAIQA
ncbi:MAG: hypothetical protein L0229_09050 [Blastocatellia bacterium]|nr:hypothetical protein [Blastocatellia bacterium]